MNFLRKTKKSSSNLLRRFSAASIESLSRTTTPAEPDCAPRPIDNSRFKEPPKDRPASPLYYTKQVYATAEPPSNTTVETSTPAVNEKISDLSSLVHQVQTLQIATEVVPPPQVESKTEEVPKVQTETKETPLNPSGSNSSDDSQKVPATAQMDISAKKARAAAAHASKSNVIRASQATTVEDFIQVAIRYHEQNRLEESLMFFRMAAENNSPIGMFLYGISLRHGWGCEPNEQLAFQYLQKAAESAVFDLNNFDSVNTSAARHELVLAIYELGVSFRHGWGVPKNKVTAAYYFEIAANLGDPDAQNDLAWCLEHGMGIKKDRKKAAYYYQKAASQGHEILGNSWIWKPKYDPPSS